MSLTRFRPEALTLGFRPYLILTLFCAGLYLPGLAALPTTDRDEARYVQATKQMLETGDIVNMRFQDEPYHKKPAGIQWLQGASVFAIGAADIRTVWPYRVPSVVGAWLAVLLTFALGARLFGRLPGLAGAGFLACSMLLVFQARLATTDTVLLATVMAAQLALARFYLSARQPDGGPPVERPSMIPALVFWVAQGIGLLIKGPITPMISILTILAISAWDRDWRWLRGLRPVIGLPVTLAIFLPWAIAVWRATEGGFYRESVGVDFLAKIVAGQESHGAPPGYYAFLLLILFWPGSLFTWPALWQGWRDRAEPAVRFCLAWLVPAWLVFELVPTKLPHYVLPLYPALALLTARALWPLSAGLAQLVERLWARILQVLWAMVGLGLAASALALPIVAGAGLEGWSLLPAALALLAAIVALRHVWRREIVRAAAVAVAIGWIVVPAMFQLIMPGLPKFWLSRALDAAVTEIQPVRRGPIAIAGYSEPSVVFRLGTNTVLTDGAGAAMHLFQYPRSLVIVDARQGAAFEEWSIFLGLQMDEVGLVEGVNYSKGKKMRLVLYGSRR